MVTELTAIVKSAEGPVKWQGPKSAPKPAAGKKIFILSDNQAGLGSRTFAAGVATAATAIGWTSTTFDGQGEVTNYAAGLSQAMSQDYNGVVLVGIDPTLVTTQLAAVRAAGIPVLDVSNTVPPSATGVNANIGYHQVNEARVLAAYVALNSNGKADIATIDAPEFGTVVLRDNSFKKSLAQFCKTCKIVTSINVTSADLGSTNLVSMIAADIEAHPSITWFVAPFDDVAVPAVEAIQQLGLSKKIKLVSYEGEAQNLSYIRTGTVQVADIGEPYPWFGWEAIDSMNRLFNGSTSLSATVTDNEPFELLVKANDPTAAASAAGWSGDFNYAAEYKKLWGVS
jgi:ribose transport system substrate-binding protein